MTSGFAGREVKAGSRRGWITQVLPDGTPMIAFYGEAHLPDQPYDPSAMRILRAGTKPVGSYHPFDLTSPDGSTALSIRISPGLRRRISQYAERRRLGEDEAARALMLAQAA